MQLVYDSPAAMEAFYNWYNSGSHKDITGRDLMPDDNPDIEAIVNFYNNEIAQGPAVEVVDG